MDLYRSLIDTQASQRRLVTIGRAMTLLFVVIGCLLAPKLADPDFKGVFNFIQEFQGYISPGIVATYLVGLVVKRAPPAAGVVGLLASAPIYGLLHYLFGDHAGAVVTVHFLLRMLITFGAVTVIMLVLTVAAPLRVPKTIPVREDLDARPSRLALVLGVLVILGVAAIFIVLR
jgi:SSS family solute:Na+ symporter